MALADHGIGFAKCVAERLSSSLREEETVCSP